MNYSLTELPRLVSKDQAFPTCNTALTFAAFPVASLLCFDQRIIFFLSQTYFILQGYSPN